MNNVFVGILMVVKDNIVMKGLMMMVVFKMLENFVLVYNVMVVDKLLVSNVLIVGKINMDEFVMGGLIEMLVFYVICNFWDISWVFGGFLGGLVVVVVFG